MSKYFKNGTTPKRCRYCYYWKSRKDGCSLGEENCIYQMPVQEKEKSECTDCPYGRFHPCIGWCTKKLLGELRSP